MKNKLDCRSLKQLYAASKEMFLLAERGDWAAVLEADNTRLQIMKNANSNGGEDSPESRQLLIDQILELDVKIKQLASDERKSVMNKEIRQQAQVAAQTSYKKLLTSDTRL